MAQLNFKGLDDAAVLKSREEFGANKTVYKKESRLIEILWEVVLEPLFLILIAAAAIYFLLGEYQEGIIMLFALALVSGISLFQERKSRNALDALKVMSSPKAKVVRNGELISINSEELVVGDVLLVEDGDLIPADANILEAHDFSVNESLLTGESLPVTKSGPEAKVYQGTLVMTGNCFAEISAIGKKTTLSKLGLSLQEIEVSKTPLQVQIKKFVTKMVGFGVVAFLIVWGVNLYISGSILDSLLHGLTLAMSVLPEEIPVAFSTFMALGAYRLYKKKIITRSPFIVETLGAATVICVDKTGTLTLNSMDLAGIYGWDKKDSIDFTSSKGQYHEVLEYALWSSEIHPFDPMEKAIHEAYGKYAPRDHRPTFDMAHEYPLGGIPPIMTHIFENGQEERIIAVKGSVEGVLKQTRLCPEEKEEVMARVEEFSSKGYRVLGVGKGDPELAEFPATQFELEFEFVGLIAFYDPPKDNIKNILEEFYRAGIEVKMITGDYDKTALAIASQVGLRNHSKSMDGAEVLKMSEEELGQKVRNVRVFSRMFPEAKLKVIQALKSNGEVVAMTGDGVNDGPALKAAHIGISMGLRGSELAKKSAAMILMDDDLVHMTEAVALGRRIYENLKKAIQYIISIHIPIILIVTLPLVLFWDYINLFSPVHVIFLELIMGPTCSIVFENEPIEPGAMTKPPRKMTDTFFSFKELLISVLQGLAITVGCLGIGYYYMAFGESEDFVRTVVFTTLIFSNLFLTLVNRSFYYSVIKTLSYTNWLIPLILVTSLIVLATILYIPSFREIFDFVQLGWEVIAQCLAVGFASVLWIEIFKLFRRRDMIR
jgi:P-type Ca2+ transporter type 2C